MEIKSVNKEYLETIQPKRLIYKTIGEKNLEVCVFLPKGQPKSCMFLIHGGGWLGDSAERLFPQAAYFAENGAIAVSIDYRLNSETTDVRDGLSDCLDALDYTRAYVKQLYGELPFIALGDSAGGYYATCLGCDSIIKELRKNTKAVDFVVDWNGIVDLTEKWSYAIPAKDMEPDEWVSVAKRFSPLYNVKQGDAPVLLMHGQMDKTVALSDSEQYLEALKEKNIYAELIVLPSAAHAFILFDYRHDNEYVAKILRSVACYFGEKGLLGV